MKEIVGDDIQLPEYSLTAVEPPEQSVTQSAVTTPTSRKKPKSSNKVKKETRQKQNLTINVNYIFGADTASSVLNNTGNSCITAAVTPDRIQQSTANTNASSSTDITESNTPQIRNFNAAIDSERLPTNAPHPIAYNLDLNTNTLHPVLLNVHEEEESHKTKSTQKKLTDYFDIQVWIMFVFFSLMVF